MNRDHAGKMPALQNHETTGPLRRSKQRETDAFPPRLRDSGGKLVREEESEYAVTPTPEGTKKELAAFSGKYKAKKGGMVSYDKSGYEPPDRRIHVDGDVVKELREELVEDEKARDGISPELFPLTTREQEKYQFQIKGEETWRGSPVYRITFAPKRREKGFEIDTTTGPWAGEVFVSRDSQPVLVTTRLARKVPMAVRPFLGTNLKGLGFSIRYEKFDEGVWFPVSFGTEFRARVLFFYKRLISVSMQSSGFRRADVTSTIRYEGVP